MQLVDADQPYWLLGMTEMTRTFGLELLETVLTQFSTIFFKVYLLLINLLICLYFLMFHLFSIPNFRFYLKKEYVHW